MFFGSQCTTHSATTVYLCGQDASDESSYSLLYGNNNYYLLLRLYYLLCDRLSYFHDHMDMAVAAATAEQSSKPDSSVETATALCLKTPRQY